MEKTRIQTNPGSILNAEDWAKIEDPNHKDPKTGESLINKTKLDQIILSKIDGLIERSLDEVDFFKERSKEKIEILDENLRTMTEFVVKVKKEKTEYLELIRGMRMASKIEVSEMMKPLEDIRKFFLGKNHEEEVKRLTEFVELCERLEKLKKSGFLDSVADTMLKLS